MKRTGQKIKNRKRLQEARYGISIYAAPKIVSTRNVPTSSFTCARFSGCPQGPVGGLRLRFIGGDFNAIPAAFLRAVERVIGRLEK